MARLDRWPDREPVAASICQVSVLHERAGCNVGYRALGTDVQVLQGDGVIAGDRGIELRWLVPGQETWRAATYQPSFSG